MGEIVLGFLALILILLALRAFVGANPSTLARALRYVGVGVLVLLAIGLFAVERPAVGAFLLSIAWGLFTGGHVVPGSWRWPRTRFGTFGSSGSSGQSSSVRTPWLEMELDHDSGAMRGTILTGAFAGKRLDQLGRDDLMAFYAEAGDGETRRLLEAYLDRTLGAEWRQASSGAEPPPKAAPSGMTRGEALKILGLAEGASADDIRAAHRRLMLQNHPDRGGSDYLASKINEAKDFLLDG